MSKPIKKSMSYDEYIKMIQDHRASKEETGSDFKSRARKVRQQGYSAAKQGKIYPRQLQNTAEDDWEDAKVYGKNTRQGQNHWRNHMKSMSNADRLLKNKKR